jgi:acyl-CoA oxidase
MTFDNNVPTKFPNLKPGGPGGEALLEAERAKASFDVKALSNYMYTEEWLEQMNRVLQVVENDPAFDKSERYYRSRNQHVTAGLRKDKRMVELARYY